jgi:DNA transposition AAA+ family ATPase
MTTTPTPQTIAVLKNVTAAMVLLETLIARPPGLPGLGVMSEPSGFGKTIACQYAQNELGAIYIEARNYWTRKTFCEQLLIELGMPRPRGTIAHLMGEIITVLGNNPDRPLIIDEADVLVDIRAIELVRDIYETTQVPVLLVGEELLPQKLAEFERVHNRVLDWVLAEPCDQDDTAALAGIVCPKLELGADLLDLIRQQAEGRARRIVVSLHDVASFARREGLDRLDASSYGGRLFTGAAPRRHGRAA